MSSNVEERVVEMRFDNKQFEKNADQTMKTLDALDKSLDLKGSTEGFKNLEKAAKNLDLSAAADAVEAINSKFSILGTIGDQVLRNLTNRAADFAISWAKSMTLDQMSSGWRKYEAKTQAVQVIMHATGKDINTINESLEDLTWYTDQTSYSFDQMIDAISKFTGAGIELEDAEKMSEGIANWAASAGVSAQRAAPAFYNLSQAMSSGALRAQDWKSIELLNMNTAEFEEKAIEIAQAMIDDGRASAEMAAAFKKANPKVQGFRDTLSTGWLDKDVMRELFKAYADRTTDFGNTAFQAAYEAKSFTDAVEAAKEAVASGWANIFEQIFGNYEEAKVFWTEVADAMIETFSAPTTALSELLTEWHKGGGYEAFINSIRNAWAALQGVAEAVKETFANIFPGISVEKLIDLTKNFENLTQRWKQFAGKIDISELEMPADDLMALQEAGEDLTWYWKNIKKAEDHNKQVDKNLQPLTETFQGIFSVLNLVKATGTALFKLVIPFTKLLVPIAKLVGVITSALGRMSTAIANAILESEPFNWIISKLTAFAELLATALTKAADKIATFIDNIAHIPVVEKFLELLSTIYGIIKELASPYVTIASEKISELFETAKNFISSNFGIFLDKASKKLEEFGKKAKEAAPEIKKALGTALNYVGDQLIKIWQFLKRVGDSVVAFWKEKVLPSGIFDRIMAGITSLGERVKTFATTLIDFIRNGGLAAAFNWIKEQFNELVWQLRHVDFGKILGGVISLSTLIQVVALLRTLNGLKKTTKSLRLFFTSFPEALKSFSKGLAVKRIAASLLMIAAALWVLASIDYNQLKQVAVILGILAVGIIGLSLAMNAASGLFAKKGLADIKNFAKMITAILVISTAMLGLAFALKMISNIDSEKLKDSVLALLAIMVVLVAGVAVLGLAGSAVSNLGFAFLAITAAVVILVLAFDKLKTVFEEVKKMDLQTLVTQDLLIAFGEIAAALIAAAIVLKIVGKECRQVSLLVLSIGASILMMSFAIEKLAQADAKGIEAAGNIVLGLLVVLAALAGISALMNKGSSAKSIFGIALALISLAASLHIIVGVLNKLMAMDSEQLKQGVVELGIILGMLAATMLLASFGNKGNGGAFIGLAITLGIIIGVLEYFKRQDLPTLLTSVAVLTAVLVALGAAMLLSSPAGFGKKSWAAYLAFAAVIVSVMAALAVLSNIPSEGLASAAIGLSATLIALGIGMRKAGKNAANFNWRDLLAMAGIAVAIAGGLYFLAKMPMGNVIVAAAAMSTAVLALSASMRIISQSAWNLNPATIWPTLATMFAVAALAVGGLWAVSKIFAGANILGIVGPVMALETVMPIIAASTLIVSKAANSVKGLKFGTIAGVIGTMVAVAAVAVLALAGAKMVFGSDPKGAIQIAGALAIAVLAMVPVIAAFAVFTKFAQSGATLGNGLTAIGFMAEAMVAVAVVIGALALIGAGINALGPQALAGIQTAEEVLVGLGEAIGRIIGGIVGGAIVQVCSDLNTAADFIASACEKLSGITMDASVAESLKSLAIGILALTAADVLDGLNRFFGGDGVDFATFAAGVAEMGPALNTFATKTAGIDGESVKNAADAIGSLADVAKKLPRTGGWLQKAIGEVKTLRTFANELSVAAPHMNKFARLMAQNGSIAYNDDKVKAASEAIGAMIDVANKLPREGGWLQGVIGEVKSLPDFCKELTTALPDMKAFAEASPGLAEYKDKVLEVATFMESLVQVGNAIKPTNKSYGWGAYVEEAQSLGEFFSAFGAGVQTITEIDGDTRTTTTRTTGITQNLVALAREFGALTDAELTGLDKGIEAIGKLVELGAKFQLHREEIHGLFTDKISEDVSGLDGLAGMLDGLGDKLVAFSEKMGDSEISNFDSFAWAVLHLANAETKLKGIEGFNLSVIGEILATTADNFVDASTTFKDVDFDEIESVFTWMQDNYSLFTDKGLEAVKALYATMRAEGNLEATTVANELVQNVFGEGGAIKNSFNRQKAWDAGKYLVEGFAAGITNNIKKAEDAATILSNRTITQMRKTLRIESPSRVMRKIGGYTGEGFVLGLEDWVSASATAGDDLARSVTESAAGVLGYIGDLMNGDLVVDMTIRPVLDLTNMQPGLAAIDTMFSQRQALAAQIDAGDFMHRDEVAELVDVSWRILKEIQNGRDVYLDGKVLATSMNRRLGRMEGMGV